MKIFYLVWCRETGYAHYEHDSLKSAEAEAERLARHHHPGRKFFVLEVKSAVVKNDVVWEKNNDGIPY